jgi:hypothetical protein
MFGKAWADAFVEEFLFDLCCRQEPPPGIWWCMCVFYRQTVE